MYSLSNSSIILFMKRYTFGTLLLAFLCLAEAVVIILSMTGSVGRRTNGVFDITMLVMILLTYTLSQTDRDLKRWNSIQSRSTSTLDLRLPTRRTFSIQFRLARRWRSARYTHTRSSDMYCAKRESEFFCYCRVPNILFTHEGDSLFLIIRHSDILLADG